MAQDNLYLVLVHHLAVLGRRYLVRAGRQGQPFEAGEFLCLHARPFHGHLDVGVAHGDLKHALAGMKEGLPRSALGHGCPPCGQAQATHEQEQQHDHHHGQAHPQPASPAGTVEGPVQQPHHCPKEHEQPHRPAVPGQVNRRPAVRLAHREQGHADPDGQQAQKQQAQSPATR
jgi:hypothetical protein